MANGETSYKNLLIVFLVVIVYILMDHLFGNKVGWRIGHWTTQYIGHHAFMALLVVFILLFIYLTQAITRKEKENIRNTFTPKMSSQEYQLKLKQTTLAKLQELKTLPEYKSVLEEARNREAPIQRGVSQARSNAGSLHELETSVYPESRRTETQHSYRPSQTTYVHPRHSTEYR